MVRFAATQHRFMIKMRHWQSTLNRVKGSNFKDTSTENSSRAVDVCFTAKKFEKNMNERSVSETETDLNKSMQKLLF